jgi:flagellar protein FlaJ
MFENVRDWMRIEHSGKLPFADLFSRLRTIFTRFLEDKKMGSDLLFMSTYMASVTTAGVTRPEIFEYTASRQEYVPARYVEKVQLYVKRWSYSYVEALVIVADKIRNEMLKSMFNRYANSIEAGVPDDDFLTKELGTIRSVYRNTYEQGLEMLKKWGDAYIAMLFSASLIGIIIMISTAIYAPEGIESTLNMSYLIVLMISLCGISIMYMSVPEDKRTHRMVTWQSREQDIIRKMERIVLPVLVVTSFILYFTSGNIGLIFLMVGILLAPLGIIGFIDDSKIIKRDHDFATFIRGLGSIMGGKGTTTIHALSEVDRESLPYLGSHIDSVYSKLNLGLDEKRCWERFIGESGSNLIYKYLNIFRDSVGLGGKPDIIGQIVSTSVLEQVLLREKRNMFSKGFLVLLVPMHAAMVAIFVFLFHVMLTMSKSISTMMGAYSDSSMALSGSSMGPALGGMNMFINFPEPQMTVYILVILTMITVSNIVAGKIVAGGDRYMVYLFASVLCFITGFVFIVAPIVVHTFFNFSVVGVT